MSVESQKRNQTGVASVEKGDAQQEKPRDEPVILSSAEEDAAGKVYPPAREAIPVMAALFMALFLVSLVSAQIISQDTQRKHFLIAIKLTGPHHHCYRHSCHDRPVQLGGRYRLVFKRVHAHRMRISTVLWSHLYLLRSKMGVHEQHCYVRAWVIDMWSCPKLFGIHHWESSRRHWLSWYFLWKHCFDGPSYPPSPTTNISGCHGCGDHDFLNSWSNHRGSFHDEIDVEMVSASLLFTCWVGPY